MELGAPDTRGVPKARSSSSSASVLVPSACLFGDLLVWNALGVGFGVLLLGEVCGVLAERSILQGPRRSAVVLAAVLLTGSLGPVVSVLTGVLGVLLLGCVEFSFGFWVLLPVGGRVFPASPLGFRVWVPGWGSVFSASPLELRVLLPVGGRVVPMSPLELSVFLPGGFSQ